MGQPQPGRKSCFAEKPVERAVVISPGLWRGFEVSVQPPVASQSLHCFRNHSDALAYAEKLAGAQGWSLSDLVND